MYLALAISSHAQFGELLVGNFKKEAKKATNTLSPGLAGANEQWIGKFDEDKMGNGLTQHDDQNSQEGESDSLPNRSLCFVLLLPGALGLGTTLHATNTRAHSLKIVRIHLSITTNRHANVQYMRACSGRGVGGAVGTIIVKQNDFDILINFERHVGQKRLFRPEGMNFVRKKRGDV